MTNPNKIRFIGLFILFFILVKADWTQIKKMIQMADPVLIGTCLIGYLPLVWIKSERWRYIFSLQGHHLKWVDSLLIYMSSIYLGLVTPGRLGEFAKVLYIKQHKITNASRAFSSVFLDRLFDIYLFFVVAMVGLLILVPHFFGAVFGLAGIFLAVVIPWSFVGSKKTPPWFFLVTQKYFSPNTSSKLIEWVNLFIEDAKCIQGKKLGWVVIMTILAHFFYISNSF